VSRHEVLPATAFRRMTPGPKRGRAGTRWLRWPSHEHGAPLCCAGRLGGTWRRRHQSASACRQRPLSARTAAPRVDHGAQCPDLYPIGQVELVVR